MLNSVIAWLILMVGTYLCIWGIASITMWECYPFDLADWHSPNRALLAVIGLFFGMVLIAIHEE